MKLIVIWCLLIFSGVGMASFDGNGDQMDDLIWHHQSSGALYQYQLSSNHIQSIDYLATVPPEWSAWRGDFNGDGLSDLLWQHQTSGELWIYLMNNTQRLLSRRIARVGSEWQIRAVVDINGDESDDIVFRHQQSGVVWAYQMVDGNIDQSAQVAVVADLNWQITSAGDINGDGNADLVWRHQSSGQLWAYLLAGTQVQSSHALGVASSEWRLIAAADTNQDGVDDLIWRNQTTGANWLYLMAQGQISQSGPINNVSDQQWQIAMVGDFNGDAMADLLWRHQQTGVNWLYFLNGQSIVASQPLNQVSDMQWRLVNNQTELSEPSCEQLQNCSPITANISASRTQCASPCTIVFSAENTQAEGLDEHGVWRELIYHWDFDSDETDQYGHLYSQQYTYVEGDTAHEIGGPMATKTFLCDHGTCQYQVGLRAQNAAGQFDDAWLTIEVQSESQAWTTANTLCVSNTLDTAADWTGFDKACPQGATKLNQLPDADDFANKLILLHKGDTFSQNIAPMMSQSNFKIGFFGDDDAPKPFIDGQMVMGVSRISGGELHAPTLWWTFASHQDVAEMGWPENITIEGIKAHSVSLPMSYQHIGLHDIDLNRQDQESGGYVSLARGNLYCYDFPEATGNGLPCDMVPFPKGAYLSKVEMVGGDNAETGGMALNIGAIGCGMTNYVGMVDSYIRKAFEHNLRVMGWYRLNIMRNHFAGEHYASSKQKITTRVCRGGPGSQEWQTDPQRPATFDQDIEGRTRADASYGNGTSNWNSGAYIHVSRYQVTQGNRIGDATVAGSQPGGPKYQTNIVAGSGAEALAVDVMVSKNQFENEAGQNTVDINARGAYFSCIDNQYSPETLGNCFPSLPDPIWQVLRNPEPLTPPLAPGS